MLVFLAALFSGFLAKHADDAKNVSGLAAGALYGLLLAWAAAFDALVAVVFVPAVLANLVAGKIDSKAHALGFAAFAASALYFRIPAFDLGFALLALLAALADESVPHRFVYERPFLPLAALIASVSLSSATPFLAVLVFDAGYLLRQWGEGRAFGVFTERVVSRKTEGKSEKPTGKTHPRTERLNAQKP